MNRPQHRPTVTFLFDDDPDAHEVEDFVELLAAHDHLLVDAPEVLRSSLHLGLDREGLELVEQRLHDLLEVGLALGLASGDHLLDLGVALGVQGGEAEVLELPLDLLDPEAVRERRVDVEGLLGDGALPVHGHHRDRAHVVQSVGQFDQQDPPVLGHGDEHLADRRRLLGLFGVEFEPVELGHAVHDRGHLFAEFASEPLGRHPGVLDGVVQQRRGDRRLVHAQIGRDVRDGDRVGHVGLAGAPQLTLVGVDRH